MSLSETTLLRHAAFLGSSGSGKTVACKALCEEAALLGIPVIAVDPQGDIASLKIPGDAEELRAKGVDPGRLARFSESVEVRVFTPGSHAGIPIGANPLSLPDAFQSEEDRVRTLSVVSGTVARLLGHDADDAAGRSVNAFLYTVLDASLRAGSAPRTLAELAEAVASEREKDGAAALLSARRRADVEKGLRVLSVGAARLLFGRGDPLDVGRLLAPGRDGRARINVVLLTTLGSQDEKDVFVSILASAVHAHMLARPSEGAQALFYVDEIAPFLPPVRKPASKEALRFLFKQARKFGVACLVATQNPGDIDYTALAQFGTWGLGRLSTRQDIRKVSGVVKSLDPKDADAVLSELPALRPGRFVVLSPDEFAGPRRMNVRWLLTRHRTLEESAVRETTSDAERAEFFSSAAGPPAAAKGEAPPPEPKAEAPLPERIHALLHAERRAMKLREVFSRAGGNRHAVTAALRALTSDERIVRKRSRNTTWVWDSAYRFLPENDLVLPVELAEVRVLEPRARALARDACARRWIFFRDEDVSGLECRHLPLHVIALEGGGEVMVSAFTRKFVAFDPDRGFEFLDSLEGRADVPRRIPLRALVPVRSVTPGEIALPPADLKKLEPRERAIEAVRLSLGATAPRAATLLFAPLWRATLVHGRTGKERDLLIDGLAGRTV